MTAVWLCDSEQELEQEMEELDTNPDFTYLGRYDSINEIYEELGYQGFTDEQIEQMTKNRYGNCLEILEYASNYTAYIGAR